MTTTLLRILVAFALLAGVLWAGVPAGAGRAAVGVRDVATLTDAEMAGVTGGDPIDPVAECWREKRVNCTVASIECTRTECPPPDPVIGGPFCPNGTTRIVSRNEWWDAAPSDAAHGGHTGGASLTEVFCYTEFACLGGLPIDNNTPVGARACDFHNGKWTCRSAYVGEGQRKDPYNQYTENQVTVACAVDQDETIQD